MTVCPQRVGSPEGLTSDYSIASPFVFFLFPRSKIKKVLFGWSITMNFLFLRIFADSSGSIYEKKCKAHQGNIFRSVGLAQCVHRRRDFPWNREPGTKSLPVASNRRYCTRWHYTYSIHIRGAVVRDNTKKTLRAYLRDGTTPRGNGWGWASSRTSFPGRLFLGRTFTKPQLSSYNVKRAVLDVTTQDIKILCSC